MTPLLPWIAAGAAFLAVGTLGRTLHLWRLASLDPHDTDTDGSALPSVLRSEASASRGAQILAEASQPIRPEEAASLEQELIQSGLRDPVSQTSWHASRVFLAVTFAALTLWGVSRFDLTAAAVGSLLAAFVGFQLPRSVLRGIRTRRQLRISAGVPIMLDLLVSAVEGGLGVDVAMRHVAVEMRTAAPELAEELDYMNAEVTTGTPRSAALRRLADRTGLDSLYSLAHTLGQVERQGSGIAQSIRSHVRLERRRRMLDAESRAAEASPKMTVVMILFLMPALFVILMGPAVINVTQFLGLTRGGA